MSGADCRWNLRRSGRLSLWLAFSLVGMACSDRTDTSGSGARAERTAPTTAVVPSREPRQAGDPDSFYLEATDQDGDGKTIVIDKVVLTGTSGWVVIHSDVGGSPGPILAVSDQLPSGISTNIEVELTRPLFSRASVIVMMHGEDNGNSSFDFPQADAPRLAEGSIVAFPLQIDVLP